MTQPTPTLADWLPKYQADDNEWSRLADGDQMNLFNEALERIDRLEAALAELVAAGLDDVAIMARALLKERK